MGNDSETNYGRLTDEYCGDRDEVFPLVAAVNSSRLKLRNALAALDAAGERRKSMEGEELTKEVADELLGEIRTIVKELCAIRDEFKARLASVQGDQRNSDRLRWVIEHWDGKNFDNPVAWAIDAGDYDAAIKAIDDAMTDWQKVR